MRAGGLTKDGRRREKGMADEKRDMSMNVTIDADLRSRRGSFSDLVMARTKGGTTRLDFLQIEESSPDGETVAVLTARVFMDRDNIIALRDMLNDHTSSWEAGDDGAQA